MEDKKKKAFVILLLGLTLLAGLVHLLFDRHFLYWSYDFMVKNIGGKHPHPHQDVMLLIIDEPSMRYGNALTPPLGRWPWSRRVYPEIIDFINKTNPPKAILFDILFTESETTPGVDERFAAAMREQAGFAGRNIFHNALLTYSSELQQRIPLPRDIVRNFTIPVKGADKIRFAFNKANEYTVPLPCLRSLLGCKQIEITNEQVPPVARGIAIASFKPDISKYRRGRILFKYGDNFFPSFTLAAIMAYAGATEVEVMDGHTLKVGKYRIPVDDDGKILVNFHTTRVTNYSMSKLMNSAGHMLQGNIEKMTMMPSAFSNKIVIIGVSAVGGKDLKNTAIGSSTPGPELHANMISNVLLQNFITEESHLLSFIINFIIIFACLYIIIFVSSNTAKIPAWLGILVFYSGVNCWLFHAFNYLAPVYLILVTSVVTGLVAHIYLATTEGAEKRKYSKILGNLIDPQIVSEALNDLEALKQGGEKEITAFFSDVASFSTISEKLNSVQLAALLNEYLSAMTIILKKHGGTLDKYIGDAIVGIFGAPVDLPDTPMAAAVASLEMQERLKQMRSQWVMDNAYCPEAQLMHFRIGLNTGKAKVGFMGTENLASYTMMGDTVNLASRLEAAGKDYGVQIMVSEMTEARIREAMVLRKLDAVRVKGKEQPVLVYELVGKKGIVADNVLEACHLYEQGFEAYRARNWQHAIDLFEASCTTRGNMDKAVDMLQKRCKIYIEEPPPQNWDGVFTRTHK